MTRHGALPPAGWVLALASLPAMGPRRLRALLGGADPSDVWDQVGRGEAIAAALAREGGPLGAGRMGGPVPTPAAEPEIDPAIDPEDVRAWSAFRGAPADLADRWVAASRSTDPGDLWQRHVAAGVRVMVPGDDDWPEALQHDPDPPSLLVVRGDAEALTGGRRVAIVGTRRCTTYGREVAAELAGQLAAQGVRIVSGLALGIDGAAHRAALATEGAAPVVGVVGQGVDVVYPSRHRALIESVGERGVLVSEWPLGTRPRAWTFPARNRIVAALSEVVVVVESHREGGSLYTTDAAHDRDIPVMAVPGSVRSPASAGTNMLLAGDRGPVSLCRDADDVLVHLALHGCPPDTAHRLVPPTETRPEPTASDARLLDEIGWEPAALEHLVLRSDRSMSEVLAALDRLQSDGWIVAHGSWYERLGVPR